MNGNKKNTHKYVACSRLTSDLKDNRLKGDGKRYSLFTIAMIRNQPQCPAIDEYKEDVMPPTPEYYSAIKKNRILPFVTAWMDLEGIMLKVNQIRQKKTNTV